MSKTLVAAVQMVSCAERDANLASASTLIRRAVTAGAKLVVLPENFAYLGQTEGDKMSCAEIDGQGPVQTFLAEQATEHGIWLVGGTVPLYGASDPKRACAACLVYNDKGVRVARYDKMHLFDVSLPGADERYNESDSTIAGTQPVVIDTPIAMLGLSVCYDLRFPELYRSLVASGAQILAVPSAFTATTGKAHWQALLRARAIENQCLVIAPNQGGRHPSGRETHGHSMIVDCWGRIVDCVASGPGVAIGAFDSDALEDVRKRFPCLQHRKM